MVKHWEVGQQVVYRQERWQIMWYLERSVALAPCDRDGVVILLHRPYFMG